MAVRALMGSTSLPVFAREGIPETFVRQVRVHDIFLSSVKLDFSRR